MQTYSVALPVTVSRSRSRTALVASTDSSFRQRLCGILAGLRWDVREADGGAEAWVEAQTAVPDAVIVDSWLPDLDIVEFLKEFTSTFPGVEIITTDGDSPSEGIRGPHRQELLYALRRVQDTDTAAWNTAPSLFRNRQSGQMPPISNLTEIAQAAGKAVPSAEKCARISPVSFPAEHATTKTKPPCATDRIPELIGDAERMLEVSRRIRLVAPRSTPVLIEGPTGSGKELVAQALHRLSPRSRQAFVAINCAAIPEALLEAELFGHTRGAFTGAVNGRVGRIEAADGGTLFLDEIGEMPLSLQSKLLRFVESGELQRVGDNETIRVDVRIVAATHQRLLHHTQEGKFRADLYYRLAVFLIRTPSLAEHLQDVPLLVDHFLEQLGRVSPIKQIDGGAMAKLSTHTWPGNVRELEHVLERAAILAGDEPVVTAQEIDFGMVVN